MWCLSRINLEQHKLRIGIFKRGDGDVGNANCLTLEGIELEGDSENLLARLVDGMRSTSGKGPAGQAEGLGHELVGVLADLVQLLASGDLGDVGDWRLGGEREDWRVEPNAVEFESLWLGTDRDV